MPSKSAHTTQHKEAKLKMFKNNSARLRLLVVLLVAAIVTVGYVLHFGTGTLSAIGWRQISLLCPLGALTTMLAAKLFIPQAVISLVIAVVAIVLLGRVFCGWICPIPVVKKLRNIMGRSKRRAKKALIAQEAQSNGDTESQVEPATATLMASAELSEKEKASLATCSSDCSTCASKRKTFDSRHFILLGSLLSAAIFGFPVFCLICPIGLSFATILLVILLFSGGDITLSLLVVPVLLVIEVVIFKKWCGKLCPLSAFMSLIAKTNKTFKPVIDDSKCIETSQGKKCGLCAEACEESIDPRHPELGACGMNECTRCRACVDICPSKAVSVPFLPKKDKHIESIPALQKGDTER